MNFFEDALEHKYLSSQHCLCSHSRMSAFTHFESEMLINNVTFIFSSMWLLESYSAYTLDVICFLWCRNPMKNILTFDNSTSVAQ